MARNFFVLLIVVTLLVASTSADSCLGTPAISGLLSEGTPCGGAIPCARGLACDLTSTCSAVKVGDACVDDLGCPFQSSCNGPDGRKKCVAYAGTGDKCGDGSDYNSTCNAYTCLDGICVGRIGDGCAKDADCYDGHCNGGTCKTLCGTSNYCTASQYCDSSNKCAALPTTGDCLPIPPSCANNAGCVNTDLTGTKQHCVKQYSVANGGFCNSDWECATGLCWRNKCQSKSPDACVWDSWTGCALGEVCTCNNGYLITGYGTCKTEKCWDSFMKLSDCLTINCYTRSFSNPKYCYNQFCKQEFADYNTCDPSNVLWTLYSE